MPSFRLILKDKKSKNDKTLHSAPLSNSGKYDG